MQLHNQNISIHECKFEVFVKQSNVQIKFPCNYFIEWKTNNGKTIVTSKKQYQAVKSLIPINQSLNMTANLLYDKINKKFIKKQSLILLNLISKSRPDQIKLVGRVSVDLAQVINSPQLHQNLNKIQLDYCSVQSSMQFKMKCLGTKQTELHISQLDRSSFNQYLTFQANSNIKSIANHHHLVNRPQGSVTQRDFDDRPSSSRYSQSKQEIRSLGRDKNDKNRMSSSSLNKQHYSTIPRNPKRQVSQDGQKQQKYISTPITHQQINNKNGVNKNINVKPNISRQRSDTGPLSARNHPVLRNLQIQDAIPDSSNNTPTNSNNNILTVEQKKMKLIKQKSFSFNQRSQIQKSQQQPISDKNNKKSLNNRNNNSNLLQDQQKYQSLLRQLKAKDKQIQIVKQYNLQQKQQFLQKLKKYEVQNSKLGQSQFLIKKLELQLQKKEKIIDSFSNKNIRNSNNTSRDGIEKSQQETKKFIKLTEMIDQWEQKYTSLNIEYDQIKSKFKRQKQQINNQKKKNSKEIQTYAQKIKQKQKMNQMLQNNFKSIEKDNNQKMNQIIQLKTLLKQSQKIAKQNESKYKELTEANFELKQNNKQINQDLSLVNLEVKRQQQQIKRISNDKSSQTEFETQVKKLQESLKLQTISNNKLKQNILELEANNKNIQAKCLQYQDQITSLKQQLETASKNTNIIKQQSQNKLKQLNSIIQSQTTEKQKTLNYITLGKQAQIKELSQKIISIQTVNQQILQNSTKTYEQQIQKLKALNSKAQIALIQRQSELKGTIQQLENTIFNLNDQLSQNQKVRTNIEEKLKINQKKNVQLQMQIKSIKTQKQQSVLKNQQIIINLDVQLQSFQEKIKEKQEQIHIFQENAMLKQQQISDFFQQLQQQKVQKDLLVTKLQIYENKVKQINAQHQKQLQCRLVVHNEQKQILEQQILEHRSKFLQEQSQKQDMQNTLLQWQQKYSQNKLNTTNTVSKLNKLIKQKESMIQELQQRICSQQQSKVQLQNRIKNMKSSQQQMKNAIFSKQQEMKQSIYNIQQQFIKMYKSIQNKFKTIEQQKVSLQNQIKNISYKLQTKSKQILDLNLHIQELNDEIQNKNKQSGDKYSKYENELLEMKESHLVQTQQYQQRIRQLQQERKTNQTLLQSKIQSLQNQLFTSKQNIDQLKRHILEYQEEVSSIGDKLRQKQILINTIQSQSSQLKNKLQSVSKQLIDKQTKILELEEATLQSTFESSQKYQLLIKQKNQIQQKLKQQHRIISEQLNPKIQEYQTILIQQQEKFNGEKQEMKKQNNLKLDQFTQKLAQKDSQIQKQQKDSSQQKSILQTTIQSLNSQVQSLKRQIQQLNKKAIQISQQHKSQLSKVTEQYKTQLQSITQQKRALQQQKSTFALINFKEYTQKLKTKIRDLQRTTIQLKHQAQRVVVLERSLKIKSIQLNSLKYKTQNKNNKNPKQNLSSSIVNESSLCDNQKTLHEFQQIISLKDQEIQSMKEKVQQVKYLQQQIWQIETLNQSLYTEIQQLEEEKFHYSSDQNQKNIRIKELTEEKQQLSIALKDQLAKNSQLIDKNKHYQNLIIQFKGYKQETTNQSQHQTSDIMKNSRNSSKMSKSKSKSIQKNSMKAIPQIMNNTQVQLQNLIKDQLQQKYSEIIKGLKQQIQKLKQREQQILKTNFDLQSEILLVRKSSQKGSSSKQKQNHCLVSSLSQNQLLPTTISNIPLHKICKQIQQIINFRQQSLKNSQVINSLSYNNSVLNLTSKLSSSLPSIHPLQIQSAHNQPFSQSSYGIQYQRKTETLSKQFQNVKAKIMKTQGKNYQEKAKFISMLKPCEQLINQIIRICHEQGSSVRSL